MSLYKHISHPHKPVNVNVVHAKENQGINAKIAVTLTRVVGSMPTAYTFIVLALCGLLAILGILSPLVALLVAWTSQTLIQLVLLPVIMVGQNVLSRHQEIQADEMFATTQHSFSDVEQILQHLNAQDEELLKQTNELNSNTSLLKGVTVDLAHLANEQDALDVKLTSLSKTVAALQKKASGT